MVKAEKKGTQYRNQSGGNQGWKPLTSDLTNMTFDYGTRVDTGAFKRNMSLIAGKVAENIKHGGSVLGDLRNMSPPGILTNGGSNNKDKYRVTWVGVVSGRTVPYE